MKLLLENVTKNRDAWLAIKNRTIGSSEIGAVCGLSPWCTPLELWGRKTGKLPIDTENDAMWLGTKLQPIVGELFCKKTGVAIVEPDCMYAHPQADWATATPDFFAFPNGDNSEQRVLEVKTTSARAAQSWEDGNAPTLAYMQTIWQLGVIGLSKGYIAALIGGQEFKHVEVEFQAPLFNQMMDMAESFMKCVQSDTPPTAKGSDLKILNELRVLEDTTIHLPPESIDDILEFNRCAEQAKQLKDELKRIEGAAADRRARLESLLGNSSRGIVGSYEVQLKKVERKGYAVQPSTYTTFKVKELESESDGNRLGA